MDSLKHLASQKENQKCADCGKEGKMSWVSATLGSFICIECSGVHRKLGAHISLVQSLELDTWSDEQTQEVLGKGGNKEVNRKYVVIGGPSEAQIQDNWAVREAYITAKYMGRPYHAPAESSKNAVAPAGARKVCSGILRVFLKAGVNLVAADLNGKSDPYVVFTCGNQTAKSKVKAETLNPVWNETLMINVPDFDHGTMDIEVFDKDAIGSDDKMGKVGFKLAERLRPGVTDMLILKLSTQGEIHCEFEYTALS